MAQRKDFRRIGLLLPSSSSVQERDIGRALPEDITLHVARMRLSNVDADSTLRIVQEIETERKKLADVDWIIEAVVENLEIKRALLKKVEAIRKPGTIITTNTSGLPVGQIAEGFSDDFRRAWFGTHFFNPPRYMRLLELIPTPQSDRALIDAVSHFCDVRLGKGVVLAKDTPNFIGNRIGTFSVLNVMRLMQEMDLTIEDVDALTGQAVGWPKSATSTSTSRPTAV